MSRIVTYFSSMRAYPKAFWFMCLNMVLFVTSFNMLLPEMNAYITSMGGEDYKWLILGLWTFAAAISRPFSGKIADNVSRLSVMYFGVIVSILVSFMYPFFGTVLGFLSLRFLHGFSTGFQPTGATALIADLVPKGKRGEAMGIFGITISLGFSGGQAISSTITNAFGLNGLFMASGILGTISLIFLILVKERNRPIDVKRASGERVSFRSSVVPKWNEIFAPEVIPPSVVMYITAMCSGIYLMIVPDFSEYLGMDNKGLFYGVNVIFMVITRFLSGRFYDRFGAKRNLYFGLSLYIIAAFITGTSTTVPQFLLSSIVFGIASSICSPALFAWTADLANPAFKGRGMSTMFIALELGIGSGTLMAQLIYDNKPENFLYLFLAMMVLCFLGILYLILTANKATREDTTPLEEVN